MYLAEPDRAKLLSESKHVLYDTVIDERGPGTILRDFNVLISMIKQEALPLTPAHQLMLSAVTRINEQLTHPLDIGLKRPQQKSYPPIHGLFLLARASGLTRIDETGKQPLLRIFDDVMVQQWAKLNPTEQYLTLLESWLLRGKEEIIGGSPRLWADEIPRNFDESARFIVDIPETGLSVSGHRDVEERLRYWPGVHNLGLLDLFGLIRIETGTPKPGLGWQIKTIYLTTFGKALFAALYASFFAELGNIFEIEDSGQIPVGVFQPILQPYFPEWKKNLSFPESAFREGIHIFKVSLGPVWRRIAIEPRATLDKLAQLILRAFAFDNDHLYSFSWRDRFGGTQTADHPYMEEGISAAEVQVGVVPLTIGQTMTFLFDFGDNWHFDVTLEQVDTNKSVPKSGVIEKHGKPPNQYRDWDDD